MSCHDPLQAVAAFSFAYQFPSPKKENIFIVYLALKDICMFHN